jgi:hypothetical protein
MRIETWGYSRRHSHGAYNKYISKKIEKEKDFFLLQRRDESST